MRHCGYLLLLSLLAGCRTSASHEEPAGTLQAEWAGADSGKLDGRLRANWCAADRRLELFGVRGDAGVGLAVYPVDELVQGRYDVVDPGLDTLRRPGVSGAIRWFTDRAIGAYQSDSGWLDLVQEGPEYSGRFEFRMRALSGDDTLRLEGRFRRVLPGACTGDSLSTPPDTD